MVENSLGEHCENSRGAPAGRTFHCPGVGQIWHQLHPPRSEAASVPGLIGEIKRNHGNFRNGSTAFAFNSTLWITGPFL